MNTHTVGFNSVQNMMKIDTDNLLQYVLPQDLKSFGLIPEIVGRLPLLTYLEPLDRDALRRILVEPKNSIIRQYEQLLAMDGVKLEVEPEAYDYIVDKAVEFKLGARGLRSIVESIMLDVMYEVPSAKKDKFVLTKDFAEKQMAKAKSLKA